MSFVTLILIITLTMLNLRNIVSIYLNDGEKQEIFELAASNLRAYSIIYILDGFQVIL